jgi:Ca2+:H+ antiporter
MNRSILKRLARNPLYWLIVLAPVAIVLERLGADPTWVLAASALGMIPLAGLIGESTETLATRTGPRVGGLLNATLGNAAELIITIVAIREGLLELVKASITGSILGNLLLVLGASMLAGGLRHGVQAFDRRKALNDCILLVLAVVALSIPSLFSQTTGGIGGFRIEVLSLGVAALMLLLYGLGLYYTLRVDVGPLSRASAEPVAHHPRWSLRSALVLLGLSTVGVAWLSEVLVAQVEPVVRQLGVSEFFLGVVLIPIIGNVAEHLVAVTVALKNHMTLSVEIAVSSSLQVALLVVPALVFISLLFGHPLSLVFNSFELIALIGAVLIATLVSADGEASWLEGAELSAVYLMLALGFYLLPV